MHGATTPIQDMTNQKTEAPDLDLSLVREFELRKQKIQLIEEGNRALANIRQHLQNESDIQSIRDAAFTFAKQGIEMAVENVDNAIIAFASIRKRQSALDAMKFLLVLTVVSNILTGLVVWLILR
jgi:hypothetical protein